MRGVVFWLLARDRGESVPMFAVFDTQFHRTLPDYAYTYAIEHEVTERYSFRRYGFQPK